MDKYKVLDIFAGAGGLSLGFEQTGRFEITAAVELDESARKTFSTNHERAPLYDDVLKLDLSELESKHGFFDVVIGGPPCQGFSNANRQHNQLINMNNKLIKTYVNYINHLKPKAFLLENVKMLESETHRFFLTTEDDEDVRSYSSFKSESINIYNNTNYFPFSLFFDTNLTISAPTNILTNVSLPTIRKIKRSKHTSSTTFPISDLETLIDDVKIYVEKIQINSIAENLCDLISKCEYEIKDKTVFEWSYLLVEIVESIIKLDDIKANNVIVSNVELTESSLSIDVNSFTVIDFLKNRLQKTYKISSNTVNAVNYGVPQNRQRYIMVGILNTINSNFTIPQLQGTGNEVNSVQDAIGDLETLDPSYTVDEKPIQIQFPIQCTKLKNLRDSNEIHNHVITKSSSLALERFSLIKQGQNFHSLEKDMKKNYRNPKHTQNSIYLRLDASKPAPTVTNVRKAMWIHPNLNRAISVREAARLQSFPDSFIFTGTKDKQYQQVGNAVPPLLAKVLAEGILTSLEEQTE